MAISMLPLSYKFAGRHSKVEHDVIEQKPRSWAFQQWFQIENTKIKLTLSVD